MKHPSHFSMGGVTFSPDNKLDLGVTFSQVIDMIYNNETQAPIENPSFEG